MPKLSFGSKYCNRTFYWKTHIHTLELPKISNSSYTTINLMFTFPRVYNMSVSDTTYKKILSWILNSHFFTHDISCCSWSKNHLTIRPYNYGGICFAWSTNRMQIPLYLYSLAGDFYWHDHMTSCDDVTTADIMSKNKHFQKFFGFTWWITAVYPEVL